MVAVEEVGLVGDAVDVREVDVGAGEFEGADHLGVAVGAGGAEDDGAGGVVGHGRMVVVARGATRGMSLWGGERVRMSRGCGVKGRARCVTLRG